MTLASNSEIFFENSRIKLLAAFFSDDLSGFSSLYSRIYEQLINNTNLSESEHKTINQIQLFVLKFLGKTSEQSIIKTNDQIKTYITNKVRIETKNISCVTVDEWASKTELNNNQLNRLFETTIVFQITTGCSNYCKRCNEWAIPGIRKHFSFNLIREFTKRLYMSGNKDFIFYGASDPLDWKDNDNDISDIIKFTMENRFFMSYGLLTKLPLGKSKILEKLVKLNADMSISVTGKNRRRITAVEKKTGVIFNKQHDFEDLLIPSGLDEDFSSVKSSINDSYGTEITPDGAFIIIPAFTSALNPTGQNRLPVTKNTNYFLTGKTGRKALPVEYFKPLEAINLEGDKFRLKHLFDVQIENIILDNGDEAINPPGMMTLDEFFKTFESVAISRKKNMLPALIKQYRKKFLKNSKYKTADKISKGLFKAKLKTHLISCSKTKMKYHLNYTFSYFLNIIIKYLKENPEKHVIIKHLKRHDMIKIQKEHPDFFSNTEIDSLLDKSGIITFDLFQALVIRLLNSTDDISINIFINKYPALYDEERDIFIRKQI